MEMNEFKDLLFDILNETDNLPIQDIIVNDKKSQMCIYLKDGSSVYVTCENYGKWFIVRN
ncbi:hypothetical protein [Velocimicrobium porci]|uniref:Uncharacterized protein n=1 Tax=Velocimicrobium porci TaxID=2606634 RepID=A0A6L5XYY3_9FIRM|nr:hypothetical protein [Velocimicrobium porci]MSS63914.1 hypothetical protein [Velocimicrobium porci]